MNAIWIYPEDIGAATQWSKEWIDFIRKFGYTEGTPPNGILLTEIKTNQ